MQQEQQNWALKPLKTANRTSRAINALIVFVVVTLVGAAAFVQQINRDSFRQTQRNEVLTEVGQIRAELESTIAESIELLKGLVALVSMEPDIDQQRFESLVSAMTENDNLLKNVALAPDLIITMIYPVEGNERTLGVNYHLLTAQRDLVYLARDTREVKLAGPVNLVQGGSGIIVRYPIFTNRGTPQEQFWGILSAVIGTETLLERSGIAGEENLSLLIRGRDGTGADGPVFYGDEASFGNEPVNVDVNLPNGSWQISALPRDGWKLDPDHAVQLRILETLAVLFILTPILIVAGLLRERSRHRHALKGVTRRLELALSASRIGVWEYDVTNDELYWDDRMRAFYEVPPDVTVSYKDWRDALHPDDSERAIKDFEDALKSDIPYRSRFRLKTLDRERHIRSIGTVFTDDDGHQTIIGVNWDATEDVLRTQALQKANLIAKDRNQELEEAKTRIERIALHDALTGLPNRRYLDEFLQGLSRNASRAFGFLHLDLDRFKHVNDTMGHAAGDDMLVAVAEKLKKAIAPNDFVARIGGDEFVIVCQSETNRAGLERLSSEIIRQFQEPILAGGRLLRCSTSIGIAISHSAPGDPQQLMINADVALYRAKKSGRNGYKYFSAAMHQESVCNKKLADELLNGLDRDEFEAYFHPQFDAQTRQIVGVEALARWNHPTMGILTPDRFLGVAEELNVLHALDARMLDKSLEYMRIWEREGVKPARVSVNVSGRRLADPGLVSGLEARAFDPSELTFELLESTFLDQQDEVVAHNLDRIRDMGIHIEIDDFGTGYASIVSLMKLHPHRLKIDRELTTTVRTGAQSHQMVKSIVEMAHALGIDVLAEGVETMEQADVLQALGCSTFQGYAFAKPMTGQHFIRFARDWSEKQNAA